jgi:hypothetical protein
VVVTSTTLDLQTKAAKPSMIYADADKLKVVNEDTIVIYRGDLQRAWIITPSRKNYVEMTPETMRQLNAQMTGVQAQLAARQPQLDTAQVQMQAQMAQMSPQERAMMQAQMAQMPPQQRAMMEAMLAGRGGAGGPPGGPGRAGLPGGPGRAGLPGAQRQPAVNYVKAGPSKTISRMRCDMYRKTVDGAQDEDVCIGTLAATGLTAADFRVMDSFSSFMGQMSSAPQAPRSDIMSWNEMNKAIGFQGVPLDTVHFEGGTPSRQETVQKIERLNVPANTFDLPPGLAKVDIGAQR